MRLTHGVDLVDVEQFRRWLDDPRSQLRNRFTTREITDAEAVQEAAHLAGCFAAKEAALKALGIGWADGVRWTDVEVLRQESGAPEIQLYGEVQRLAARERLTEWRVSISHTSTIAIATVIGIGRDTK